MGKPTVHILLATCQGEQFLQEQLDSIAKQTYPDWVLHVSDDGSTDNTCRIIAAFGQAVSQSVILDVGQCKGSTINFFHLVNNAPINNPLDLYAFCDQDDVWLPEKLERVILHHKAQNIAPNQAYLYCGRTRVVNEKLLFEGLSPMPCRPLSFGNALLQNVAGGNTMVLNLALLKILRTINPINSVLHDWTTYQVASGCDGLMYFDQTPTILYRQHRTNLIGINNGFSQRYKRLNFMLQGGYKNWAEQTDLAMHDVASFLANASIVELNIFQKMRSNRNPLTRIYLAASSKLRRQTLLGNISFLFAVLFYLI
jgi:glycosyltransferase involved in cell wall biosynthesis